MGGDVPVSDATEGYRRERFRTTANDSQRGATSGRTPNPPERIGGAVHGEPNSFVFVWPQRTVSVSRRSCFHEYKKLELKRWFLPHTHMPFRFRLHIQLGARYVSERAVATRGRTFPSS